jgi:hypothetical protein
MSRETDEIKEKLRKRFEEEGCKTYDDFATVVAGIIRQQQQTIEHYRDELRRMDSTLTYVSNETGNWSSIRKDASRCPRKQGRALRGPRKPVSKDGILCSRGSIEMPY